MNLTSNSIKQTLNNHLKNKMPNDIIKEFPTIRNLVLAYLKLVADEKGLTKIDKKDFIAQNIFNRNIIFIIVIIKQTMIKILCMI